MALYDLLMSKSTQVAFKLDNESLTRVDELASERSQSRAALLRTAVSDLLRRQREEEIDASLAEGYRLQPPEPEAARWADVSVEGLETSGLDW